ncbi:hypothetical protein EDB84DRAFT_1678957 [Lactarius hengduanensis]|nr:hypothetical protein EDB84DRAFT_1678957 [Lactarius hengduanensis]
MESVSDDPGRPSRGGGGRTGEGGKTEVTPTGTYDKEEEGRHVPRGARARDEGEIVRGVVEGGRGEGRGRGEGGKTEVAPTGTYDKEEQGGTFGAVEGGRGEGGKDRGRSHRYLRHVLRDLGWGKKKKKNREREREGTWREKGGGRTGVQGPRRYRQRHPEEDEGDDETMTRKVRAEADSNPRANECTHARTSTRTALDKASERERWSRQAQSRALAKSKGGERSRVGLGQHAPGKARKSANPNVNRAPKVRIERRDKCERPPGSGRFTIHVRHGRVGAPSGGVPNSHDFN